LHGKKTIDSVVFGFIKKRKKQVTTPTKKSDFEVAFLETWSGAVSGVPAFHRLTPGVIAFR
jgi:hypothetical protein